MQSSVIFRALLFWVCVCVWGGYYPSARNRVSVFISLVNRTGINMKRTIKQRNEIIVKSSSQWRCLVGCCCRIQWLHLCRGVRPTPNECPRNDTKQSDGEVPVMMGLWGIRNTPSLPLLPGPLCPGMVAPDRALSMG